MPRQKKETVLTPEVLTDGEDIAAFHDEEGRKGKAHAEGEAERQTQGQVLTPAERSRYYYHTKPDKAGKKSETNPDGCGRPSKGAAVRTKDGTYLRPERRTKHKLMDLLKNYTPQVAKGNVNQTVAEILVGAGFEPITEMVKIYKDPDAPIALRFQVAREIAGFLYCKKGQDGPQTGVAAQFNIKIG